MWFNVKSVREYLIENKYVYTIRKKRKVIAWDTAVYGSRYKQERIGRIFISIVNVGQITDSKILEPFFLFSGLSSSVSKWLELARKLSGDELYLYKVELTNG